MVGAKDSSRPLPGGPRLNLRRAIRVGSWNVRTLREDHSICQLSAELKRLRVQLAALSEVRRLGRGEIRVGGYTYFWSGPAEGHTQGVAIAVADQLLPAVDDIRCVSERLMSLRLRHSQGALTVVSVYAPTNTRGKTKPDQDQKTLDKDTFYRQLESVVEGRPAGDTPLVLGDFNAQVGSSRTGFEDVVGPHGRGDRSSDNGSRLLDFARGHSLRIAGTWYQRPDQHRWTWYSNNGRDRSEIDHVLVGTRWRLLKSCRVYRSAQFDTDHRLLVAELQISIRSKRRTPRSLVFDTDKLRDESTQKKFRQHIQESGESAGPEACGDWESFRDRITSAAHDTIGVVAHGNVQRDFLPTFLTSSAGAARRD